MPEFKTKEEYEKWKAERLRMLKDPIEKFKSKTKHMDEVSRLLSRKEVKELPNILWEDEELEKLVQGRYGKGFGILAATNKRLIFVDKGFLVGLRVEDFPYDKITSIQYETGLFFGKVTIFSSGNKAEIDNINKIYVRDFAEYIRARITTIKEPVNMPTQRVDNSQDVITQIERLAKLKKDGILSEDEFIEQKKKLLKKDDS